MSATSPKQLSKWLLLAMSAFSQGLPLTTEDLEDVEKRVPPALPNTDDFYIVPQNISNYANGAIIRSRLPPRQIAMSSKYPVNLANSYQLLYRTTDSLNQPTATVLTVLIPHFADTSKILSYQVAEDASNINCAPSYALQMESDSSLGITVTQGELLLMEAALEKNWVVIVPDHQGPIAAFLSNKLAGQAVLDGIRAALNSKSITGINSNENKKPMISMWGYSGGSLVSMWAAELQPTYAPELSIAGVAAGGIVGDILSGISMVNGKASAGIIPAGILGLSHQYSELDTIMKEELVPAARANMTKANSQCSAANLDYFAGADVMSWFKTPDIINKNEVVRQVVLSNNLGQHAPKAPMFAYKGVKDEVSHINDTDALIASYCARGSIIQYERDRTANHSTMALVGVPMALWWLDQRMQGIPNPNTACNIYTVESSLLNIQALATLPGLLLNALLDLFGKPVGLF